MLSSLLLRQVPFVRCANVTFSLADVSTGPQENCADVATNGHLSNGSHLNVTCILGNRVYHDCPLRKFPTEKFRSQSRSTSPCDRTCS